MMTDDEFEKLRVETLENWRIAERNLKWSCIGMCVAIILMTASLVIRVWRGA